MKRILLISVFVMFALTSLTAGAADTANWTGAYLGGQAGYSTGKDNWHYEPNPTTLNHSVNGWFGGIFAGYNYQLPSNIVVGIETDINYSSIEGKQSCPNSIWSCNSEINWLYSTRARLGYARDQFLPYLALGMAYSDIDIYTKLNDAKHGSSKYYFGWTLGFGLEYALTKNIATRFEYAYYDFGKDRAHVDYPFTADNQITLHSFKLGMSYKF